MARRELPSVEYLHECFEYSEGKLFWKVRPREHFNSDKGWKTTNTRFASREAGCMSRGKDADRWLIKVDYVSFLRYQLVWFLHRGEWCGELDHKNRDSLDDRIENIRKATGSQNQANTRRAKNNTSGFKGVTWVARDKKWTSGLGVNGKRLHLGYFDDPAEAYAAYVEAGKKYYGEFFCAG